MNAVAAPATLDALLSGTWPDPDGGPPIAVPVRAIAIERSLAGHEVDLVAPLQLGRRLAVVSDHTTRAVMGARVERALASRGIVIPVVLDGVPHADASAVDAVRRACATADALIAVGSGTINDLCKYAASTDGKPYVVFATAPSMNGYTSTNAAITVDGHKKSLPAVSALGVFIDLTVFASAPKRMIRAGLGDSLCRSTAQADWFLSHRLLGTPYRRAPFVMLADDEPLLLDHPEALLAGDFEALSALARTLVLSGLGMTIANGSYPASQGEHLISHYLDMFAPPGRASYFHGEQVAVATLTMARIQEAMLEGAPPKVHAPAVARTDLDAWFGEELGASCWQEFEPKRLARDVAAMLEWRINAAWDDLRIELRQSMIPAATIASVLARAGCPTAPADIGVTPAFYATAVSNARFLRDRYTFLDLAGDSGHLVGLAALAAA